MLLVACTRGTNAPIIVWCAHIVKSNASWWSSHSLHCRLSGPLVCLCLPNSLSLPSCGYVRVGLCVYTQTLAYTYVCLLEWLAQLSKQLLLAFDLYLNRHELISRVQLSSFRKRHAETCYRLPALNTAPWREAAFWAGPQRHYASAEISAVPNLGHVLNTYASGSHSSLMQTLDAATVEVSEQNPSGIFTAQLNAD